MEFFHMPIQIISRDKGRFAVAAAAHRSDTRLDCTWDGRTHDYTRKKNIVYSEIIVTKIVSSCQKMMLAKNKMYNIIISYNIYCSWCGAVIVGR